MSGGFHKSRQEWLPIETAEFQVPGDPEGVLTTFFHIAKTQRWFGKLVCGSPVMGRGVVGITMLDDIKDKIKAHFHATAHADEPTAANSASSAIDTAPAESAAVADTAVSALVAASNSEDPLANLDALPGALSKANAKAKAKANRKKRQWRPAVPINTPVWVEMPNVPACVDLTCDETVRFRAMLMGKSGRDLWLDFDYFDWALSYCIDQLSRHGIVSTHVEVATTYKPNLDGVPGVWKGWDVRNRLYTFFFVHEVPGLLPGNIGLRRHMPLDELTSELWKKFACGDMSLATQAEKKEVMVIVIKAWCSAILNGTEDDFLRDNNFPECRIKDTQQRLATTAQAATAAATTSSNLNDENLQGDGVGIVCGMCVSDSDDLEGGTSCDEGSSDGDMDDN